MQFAQKLEIDPVFVEDDQIAVATLLELGYQILADKTRSPWDQDFLIQIDFFQLRSAFPLGLDDLSYRKGSCVFGSA
ncbi:hypothetical protein D3C78_1431450 [compost metagenome]